MPSKDPLPSKENALFKKVLKCYEMKQYRHGLKFARQILSNPKFSEHGETLAMKGLTLNCLGKREEAYDHVRRGLRNDLTSHVCWHVFGLLQRSDRKYDEAIKAYRNALRHDKDNLQILRDLSLLQIQMRDYDGYRETRHRLLELRPGQRASWIGYAMSWHLLKDYDMALCVIDEFRKTLTPRPYDYEYSELVVYQCSVMQEAGMTQEALNFLEKNNKDIVDRLYYEETRARLLYTMGETQAATELYKGLLDRNPENWSYYKWIEKCVEPDSVNDRLKLYTNVLENHPRASTPKKLPLSFTTGEIFSNLLDQFLRHSLRKGVPSLFMNIKSLYADDEKVKIIGDLVLSYEASLKSLKLFNKNDVQTELEPPTTLLWVQAFLAQHYDYLGDTESAISYIDLAIYDTPTLPELHMIKGRIYKHAGNIDEAAQTLDEAQSLDTADRYINCKCAKFMLRNNMVKEAENMCSQFTREGTSAVDNLNEMQCMWFQTECASAYMRRQEWGEALKKCHEVDKHFTEITEDQFDFHTYCLRKFTLRSYVALLRLEDVLRNHRFYFKAASIAIKIYLHLYSHPVSGNDHTKDVNHENLSSSELRKLRNKQRKAEKKAAQEKAKEEEAKKHQNEKAAAKKSEDGDLPKTPEIDPSKLETCNDPLEQAIRFLKPLQTLCPDRIESHTFAYEIYSRKGKLLLMLKAIKGGHALLSNDPMFHVCMVKFLHTVRNSQSLPEAVQRVLSEDMKHIYGDFTAQEFNEKFIAANINSLCHRLAGAQSLYYLDTSKQLQALKLACNLDDSLTNRTIQNCSDVLTALKDGSLGSCEASVSDYTSACHALYPYASIFAPTKSTNGPTSEGKALEVEQ